MEHVKMSARGIKRERIASFMQELVEAGKLEDEDMYLWREDQIKTPTAPRKGAL